LKFQKQLALTLMSMCETHQQLKTALTGCLMPTLVNLAKDTNTIAANASQQLSLSTNAPSAPASLALAGWPSRQCWLCSCLALIPLVTLVSLGCPVQIFIHLACSLAALDLLLQQQTSTNSNISTGVLGLDAGNY
jgi:hypothetical protein